MPRTTPQRKAAKAAILATRGPLPLPCDHCGEPVTEWGRRSDQGNIHHADGDPANNDPANLEVLHGRCHRQHHITPTRQRGAAKARWAKPEWAAKKAAAQAERDRIASRTREEMIAARNEAIRAGLAKSPKRPGPKPGTPKAASTVAKMSQHVECPECGLRSTRARIAYHRKVKHGVIT